jgi:AcrR family transcriptional regulator
VDEFGDEAANQTDPLDNENEHPTRRRRRGEALESAILDAAWDELMEVGYNRLTMEGVAARAKTNKAVLYRRWDNRAKLIMAAASKQMLPLFAPLVGSVPDTGNLREDILTYLLNLIRPIQIIGGETIRGFMAEYMGDRWVSLFLQIRQPGRADFFQVKLLEILKNAERRGEVSLENITPRVLALPGDLIRYEVMTTLGPISEAAITEIVDEIFLPLVRK